MTTKHTPTPWRIDGDESERIYRIFAPTAEDDFDYVMCNEAYYPHAPDRPTAAFIVRAVNHHEALVEMVRVFARRYDGGEAVVPANVQRARALLAALDADNA